MALDPEYRPSRCLVDGLPKAEEVTDFFLARLRANALHVDCVRHGCVWFPFNFQFLGGSCWRRGVGTRRSFIVVT